MEQVLLKELRSLEELLHTNEVRQNGDMLNSLLHPDFQEFGRSGRAYDRAEILAEFSEKAILAEIRAKDYKLAILAEGVALLTYTSAHVDEKGRSRRHTLRSSLWLRDGEFWRLRFHQGTPMDEEQ